MRDCLDSFLSVADRSAVTRSCKSRKFTLQIILKVLNVKNNSFYEIYDHQLLKTQAFKSENPKAIVFTKPKASKPLV